jgi:hypothetical protein
MRRMTKTLSLLSQMSRYRARLLLVWLTVLTGSLTALTSYAMPSMKSSDFETVYASGHVEGECIVEKDYLSSVWEAQLLRARIKNQYRDPALGWLWIDVDCGPALHNPDMFIYFIDAVWTWTVGEDLFPELSLSASYGVGSEDQIKKGVEDRINEAITEYLKANL